MKKKGILFLVIILIFTNTLTVLANETPEVSDNLEIENIKDNIESNDNQESLELGHAKEDLEEDTELEDEEEVVLEGWDLLQRTVIDGISNIEEEIVVDMSSFSERPSMDEVIDKTREAYRQVDLFRWNINSTKFMLNSKRLKLIINYTITLEEFNETKEEVVKIVEEIIPKDVGDREKVKIVNKYIKKILRYDYSYENDFFYSALKEGKATCLGYATLAKLFFDELGLESYIVDGYVSDAYDGDGYHAWNIVKIDDKWHHIDITYNDSLGSNQYLLVSDDYLVSKQRTWDLKSFPNAIK